MARPFRYRPPAPPERPLARTRLLDQLDARHHRRLVTVVAGPGFGKSALLAAALAAASDDPTTGEDLWLACEPADRSASHLTAGLAVAAGLPAHADLEAVLERTWSRAPTPTCFVLDDVHEIAEDAEGAGVLTRLVDELPGNGHVLLASRRAVPVATARLAAAGQLVRLREADLVLDADELAGFAEARGVEPTLLASTGGWPALAELTASAGADLVLDYLWEEVLASLPEDRAALLAAFAVVGGGDDEVASALAGDDRVENLVAGLPLVHRSEDGAAVLHALWTPPLRRLLGPVAADEARRAAADVHRRRARPSEAIDLLAEAGDWDGVLAVVRDQATASTVLTEAMPTDFGRWRRTLPARLQGDPVAVLAHGLELQRHAPTESITHLVAATERFRAADDQAGEVAAILAHGMVLWWMNDQLGVLGLHQRVAELAALGSARARFVDGVARAAVAHLVGDSAAVFEILDAVEDDAVAGWHSTAQWFRSVAHRRDGDLERSLLALDAAVEEPAGAAAMHAEHARLRTLWLAGEVDLVVDRLPALHQQFVDFGDRFNAAGARFELAAKLAWLGDPDAAEGLLADPFLPDDELAGAMVTVMRDIAAAAVLVARGDEEAASTLLHDDAVASIGRPDGWYWRDRGAVALVHVLVPETRDAWATEPLGPPHRVGLELAEALEATRAGDFEPLRALRWPAPGVVRSLLPLPWLAELVVAGVAAGNPPPAELLDVVGPRPVDVRIDVVGHLVVERGGEPVHDPDLRRQRVKELLSFLVIRRRARREAITEELWPELDDGARNLRVTLSYLQRLLEPGRAKGDPPYYLRADGQWLALEPRQGLVVDAWVLDELLAGAGRAEQAGSPSAALDAYRAALPLWRGEPFADLPYAPWADLERTRLRHGYVTAAVRAGELLLAAGQREEATAAAEWAIGADPAVESAYQLLARAHLGTGDEAGARLAVERCRAALAELDLTTSPATEALLRR